MSTTGPVKLADSFFLYSVYLTKNFTLYKVVKLYSREHPALAVLIISVFEHPAYTLPNAVITKIFK